MFTDLPFELLQIFARQGSVATFAQLEQHLGRRTLQRHIRNGVLVKIWPNIYCWGQPTQDIRLNGLNLRCGEPVAICLGTAAAAYEFDTENTTDLHVLHPIRAHLRTTEGLMVHHRGGAPLTTHLGRYATAPAWTAVEVARTLLRPRALATLDAALRTQTCTVDDLLEAAQQQAKRKHIRMARELIPLARPEAESPMESEARLVMHDAGLPEPKLQYSVIDHENRFWRLDFAWPDQMFAVEYDGFDWHSSREHLKKDRQKRAALQELKWRVLYVVANDVRVEHQAMVRRIETQLRAPNLARGA
ncbi:hypothetical protein [Mycolicibacterium confluentis]|uniref:Uncharacterized protein n=1 Tax=Mycolicibacterium confluentis TaxID=28047 RepID=A0A7I7Y056_9MYCO|nr:hypothetical protein [Mycolicibacterium confluentis]MCV7319945.1 hypothetical protein [Mycolicibacterium confluentis]ORV34503.1 hypothetical protein AWB99_02515 [Mycolicibacterium confluentis]BBZ34976.1 hypothetical protein MCNF_35810 [Mycolicibacterium confluentis]